MDQYLYLLFSRSPRRIKVIENVLQNHRTQANLFWAFNYGILDWLGADRRMRRADLANWLSQAQAKGLMQVDQQSVWLTPAGLQRQQQVVQTYYQPHFTQWTWLSNPSDFADRFSLGIQALSELVHNEKKYVPLSLSITEMTKVRTWLMTKGLQTTVYQELMAIGTQLEKQDPRLATLFAHELFGYQLSGWTLEQASSQLHVHLEEAMMMDRDLWLGVAHLVSARPGNLQALMGDLLAAMPISASAWLTVQQLQAGKSVQQIAMMRHLKPSTIREHLLEAAIIIPQALDWDRLLPAKTRQQLATQYHGPVLKWQFIKPAHQDENAAFLAFVYIKSGGGGTIMTDDQLDQILQNKFGFTSFRPGQKGTLQALLANQATLAVLPTGSGKSLLFQLPAYLFKGLIVVISPLIALMQDQVDRLRAQGQFKVALINSALSFTERKQTLVQLDQYRFLFISPESLANAQVQQRLQRMSIGLFVIDEAHCISQWGPDFRPEYLLLKQIIQNLIPDHLLMLTATATPAVQNDIINKLGLKKNTVKVISRSVDRPNIFLAVKKVADEEEKRAQLLHLLQQLKTSGVVYLSSRKLASEMAAWVQEKSSLKVAAYHAGQNRRERFVIQQQFMQGQLDVIFATSAFGMGIDKGNIRFVIHYHLPGSLEAYWQEIGRAGRDGQAAIAILLYAPGDESLPAMLMSHELPTDDQVQLWKKKSRQPQIMGPNGEVVAFYLEHGWSLKQVGQLFNQQYQQGLQRLYNMRGYVNTPTCRREYVLHYFAEEMRSKPENCCDIDQSHWSIDQLKLPQEKPAQAVMHDNWQQRLQRLLGSE